MKRIVIIGATGSGKTTLAEKISAALGHEFIDLDELHWLPEWKIRDAAEFAKLVEETVTQSTWVLSGNYRSVRQVTWALADMVVWLDYSFPRVFLQLLRRSFLRVRGKTLICNGNFETLPKFFSKDSIIVWLFKSYWKRKREISAILDNPAEYPHITFIRFGNPRETQAWLHKISSPS